MIGRQEQINTKIDRQGNERESKGRERETMAEIKK